MAREFIVWSVALVSLLAVGRPARAQSPPDPNCQSFETYCQLAPSSLVVAGSPALRPVLEKMSAALKKETGVDIYYLRGGTQCQGAQQVIEGADLGERVAHQLGDKCCILRPGIKADAWVTDSAPEDCFDGQKPAGYRDFLGPIASYAVVAPAASPQRAITAEEAYFVFGFGSAGYKGQTVTPWNDLGHMVIPGVAHGTQMLWARFLRLPATPRMDRQPRLNPAEAVKGTELGGPDEVMPGLFSWHAGGPGAIGLTSTQAYDADLGSRNKVRALAVQAWGQKYAFYADSTLGAYDKRNVREGRYPFWAPTHFLTRADVTGRPLNARAEAVVNYLQQKVSMPTFNVLDAIVGGRLIPACAMKVQRKADAGDAADLIPFTPPMGTACGCYMDDFLSRGTSGCAPCTASKPCSGGKTCSHGFCE